MASAIHNLSHSDITSVLEKNDLLSHSSSTKSVKNGGLTTDSRRVEMGDCFLAYKGITSDGHAHIESAIKNGAGFLVVEDGSKIPTDCSVPWCETSCGRSAWSWLSAHRFGNPQTELRFFGITGTNGKTSTAWMVSSVLFEECVQTLTIGTLGATLGQEFIPTTHTTPDPDDLFSLLAKAVDQNINIVVMEASSHAMVQKKLLPLTFDGLVFTSFSRDHLDFHLTMEDYWNAKWELFTSFTHEDTRMAFCSSLSREPNASSLKCSDQWTYGPGADKKASSRGISNHLTLIENDSDSLSSSISLKLVTRTETRSHTFRIPFVGSHALENFAAAFLLAEKILERPLSREDWSDMTAIPGRLEPVICEGDTPTVYVDYAHTPDALEKTLTVLRGVCTGNLWVVFGCGGDRDSGKRPEMGAIAAEFADHVVVTSDNPRSEKPNKIIQEIMASIKDGEKAVVKENRRDAIEFAISSASLTDIVLVAGKGHETYQIIGDETFEFDDRKVSKEFLGKIV